jgi:hypothetical protein
MSIFHHKIIRQCIVVHQYCRIGSTPSSNDSFKWPIVFTQLFWINQYLHFWLEYGILEWKTSMLPDSEEVCENYWSFKWIVGGRSRPDSTVFQQRLSQKQKNYAIFLTAIHVYLSSRFLSNSANLYWILIQYNFHPSCEAPTRSDNFEWP